MGLARNDLPNMAWIGLGPAEKPDFIVEGRRILANKGSAKPRRHLGRLQDQKILGLRVGRPLMLIKTSSSSEG